MHRLVIALVALIGLTGATFLAGYLFLFSSSTDRAAALAPANSAVYLNVYLQPSTGQQMNLGGLIGRLPGFADEASLDEKVDQVVDNLLASTGLGLDYREQIKPWLGNQVAVAAWPSGADPADAAVVLIAEVKDRAAADASLAEIAATSGAAPEVVAYQGVDLHLAEGVAYAFVGEMRDGDLFGGRGGHAARPPGERVRRSRGHRRGDRYRRSALRREHCGCGAHRRA